MKTYHFYFSSKELSRSNTWYEAEFWLKRTDWDEAFEDALELLHADGAEYADEEWYIEAQDEEPVLENSFSYYEVIRHELGMKPEIVHQYVF